MTNFTVSLRMLYDNKHGSSGNPAVMDVVGYYMNFYGYDPKKATYSVIEQNTTSETYNCGSLYGDSARLMNLSELTSGLGAGVVGLPSGYTTTNGLRCGGSVASTMPSQPRNYNQPNIIDVHVYNDFAETDENGVTVTFDEIRNFLDSFAPTNPPGWRGSNPDLYDADVMIGETFSGEGCLPNGGSTAADSIVDGYNDSDLTGGNTFIVRPWINLVENFSWPEFTGSEECYPFEMSVTPPYSGTP